MTEETMLNVKQVATKFRVTEQTVRRWASKGKIEHRHTPGKGLLIPVSAVEAFLGKHCSPDRNDTH